MKILTFVLILLIFVPSVLALNVQCTDAVYAYEGNWQQLTDSRFYRTKTGPAVMGVLTWEYFFQGTVAELEELLTEPLPNSPAWITWEEYQQLPAINRAWIAETLEIVSRSDNGVVFLSGSYSRDEQAILYQLKIWNTGKATGDYWRDPAAVMVMLGL